MEPSIFTRIINGEIPCHKVYENDRVVAFLDIHPIQPGHTLVVSKRQVENFYELNDAEYQSLFEAVKRVAHGLKRLYPESLRIGVMVEGLDVPHVHVKVFPFNNAKEFRYIPDMNADPNHAALANIAERLAEEMKYV